MSTASGDGRLGKSGDLGVACFGDACCAAMGNALGDAGEFPLAQSATMDRTSFMHRTSCGTSSVFSSTVPSVAGSFKSFGRVDASVLWRFAARSGLGSWPSSAACLEHMRAHCCFMMSASPHARYDAILLGPRVCVFAKVTLVDTMQSLYLRALQPKTPKLPVHAPVQVQLRVTQ